MKSRNLFGNFILRLKPWQLISYIGFNNSIQKLLQFGYYKLFKDPNSLKIHLNYECNYRCDYCYSGKFEKKSPSTSYWIKFISNLQKINSIEISGGEPFLYDGLFEVLDVCDQKCNHITIYTNGTLLNKEMLQKLKKYKDKLIISVKYDSANSYNKHIKGEFNIEQIEENIRRCAKEFKTVSFITVNNININELKEMLNRIQDLGSFPAIEKYIPVNGDMEMVVSSKDWRNALLMMMDIYGKYSRVIDGVNKIQGNICSCFRTQLSIKQNGEVLPCQFLPESESVGNINDKNISEIWDEYLSKRDEILKVPTECIGCKSENKCNGGCLTAKHFFKTGKDPFCLSDIPTTYGHCVFTVLHYIDKNDNSGLRRLG